MLRAACMRGRLQRVWVGLRLQCVATKASHKVYAQARLRAALLLPCSRPISYSQSHCS